MAEIALRLDVNRGSQRQDTLHEIADPEDSSALQGILRGWLEAAGIDRGLWRQYKIRTQTASGRYVEVGI